MSDELTRAIAEAIIEEDVLDHHQWCESNYTSGCNCLSSRETTATKIAAALAPLIEARVREARADGAADAYADVMRRAADESMACRRVAQDARNA